MAPSKRPGKKVVSSSSSSSQSCSRQVVVKSRVRIPVGGEIQDPSEIVKQTLGLPEWIPRLPLTMEDIPALATDSNPSSLQSSDVGRIRAKYVIPLAITLSVPDRN